MHDLRFLAWARETFDVINEKWEQNYITARLQFVKHFDYYLITNAFAYYKYLILKWDANGSFERP